LIGENKLKAHLFVVDFIIKPLNVLNNVTEPNLPKET